MKKRKMMMVVIAIAIAVASLHHHKKQPIQLEQKQVTATDIRSGQSMALTLMPADLLLFFLTH
jgi:hypothetical protein